MIFRGKARGRAAGLFPMSVRMSCSGGPCAIRVNPALWPPQRLRSSEGWRPSTPFMLAVLSIVAPVFALMALGFLVARRGILPDGAGQALAQFAFKIAMPALLFRAMLKAEALPSSLGQFLLAYFAPLALLWAVATAYCAYALRKPAEDHAAFAMGATFGNTVMLGIPIAITAFGQQTAAPLAILIAIEAPLLWIAATLQIEIARRGRDISTDALKAVFKDLATNPIILSLVLGAAGRAAGLTLPDAPDRFIALLGQAGVPVALFALGMVLAGFRVSGETQTIAALSAFKLLALPALVYVSAAHVFVLPPQWTVVLVLQAAMPVGANVFLFAARYERSAPTVSAAIVVSTVVAVVTVSAMLLVLQPLVGR
jgi:malonate transporter and related proteins